MEIAEQKLEVLQGKLDGLIADKSLHNQDVFSKIEHDFNNLEDYIVDFRQPQNQWFNAQNGNVQLWNVHGDQILNWGFHPHALNQLAEKMGVPAKYVRELNESQWGRELIVKIMTDHKANYDRERLLIRQVDGQVRGVLSDKYRRLNSKEIYTTFLEHSREQNAVLYSSYYNHTRTGLSTLIPRVFKVATQNNGDVYTAFGAEMRNSDYGNGKLSIHLFQLNVVCVNGMISNHVIDQVHLGKRLPDNISFSDETYKLDTAAMASAVKDVMGQLYSTEAIEASAKMIQESSMVEIEVQPQMERLSKMGFHKPELEAIAKKMIDSNPEEGIVGKPTLWKLSQAITAMANESEVDRKHELDALAGKFVNFSIN